MNTVISIVSPLLLVAVIGFAAVRTAVMSVEQLHGLAKFLVLIAIPALLLLSLASMDIRAVLDPTLMLAYVGIGAPLAILAWLVVRFGLGKQRVCATTVALGVAIPNNIILGYPLSAQVFGDAVLPVFAGVLLIENVIYLPLAYLVYEWIEHNGSLSFRNLATIGRRVVANPITLSVSLGLACAYWSIALASSLEHAMDMLGAGVTGVALFVIGGMLASASKLTPEAEVWVGVVMRLVLAPVLAVVMCSTIVDLGAVDSGLLLLLSAAPCFSILPAIATPYGAGLLGARIQITGTVVSLITLPIILYYVSTTI